MSADPTSSYNSEGKSKTKLFTLKWFYFNIGTKESPPSLVWRERKTGLGTVSRYRMLLQRFVNLYHSAKPSLKNHNTHISLSQVINVSTASRFISLALCRELCWTSRTVCRYFCGYWPAVSRNCCWTWPAEWRHFCWISLAIFRYFCWNWPAVSRHFCWTWPAEWGQFCWTSRKVCGYFC